MKTIHFFPHKCAECDCGSSVGADTSVTCALYGGQCSCLEGVTGLQCDVCINGRFNLSAIGCEGRQQLVYNTVPRVYLFCTDARPFVCAFVSSICCYGVSHDFTSLFQLVVVMLKGQPALCVI